MRFFLFMVVVIVLLPWRVAAGNPVIAAQKFRVGVLYWSMSIPGQVAMRRGLENECARINAAHNSGSTVELIPRIAGDGPEGMERQIEQMRELIKLEVDLIIVQPTDCAALVEPLRSANRKGIPVIAYDQYISDGVLASYVTSDNYQAGYLDGEYICSKFPQGKTLDMVLVEYPYVSSTVERVDGLLDALRDAGRKYRIVGRYIAVEPRQGREAGAALLRDFPRPGTPDVVFTVNDGGGLAVFAELARAGRKEIFGATIDGDPASVEIIKAGGIIKIDSAQFCGQIGVTAMRLAYDCLSGKKIPSKVLIPVFPVTRETAKDYHGWLGPIPAGFKKPWNAREPLWTSGLREIWSHE